MLWRAQASKWLSNDQDPQTRYCRVGVGDACGRLCSRSGLGRLSEHRNSKSRSGRHHARSGNCGDTRSWWLGCNGDSAPGRHYGIGRSSGLQSRAWSSTAIRALVGHGGNLYPPTYYPQIPLPNVLESTMPRGVPLVPGGAGIGASVLPNPYPNGLPPGAVCAYASGTC